MIGTATPCGTDWAVLCVCGHNRSVHIAGGTGACCGGVKNDTCRCASFTLLHEGNDKKARPTMNQCHMRTAAIYGDRSACQRRVPVGCIIVNAAETNILAIGYNGPPRGLAHECNSGTPGGCGCVHAEVNALLKAPYGAPLVMFTTLEPCVNCASLIINSSVTRLYYRDEYRSHEGLELLRKAGVIFDRMETV